MKELEAVIWCAKCREDRFEVWRIPVENSEGVFRHVTNPPSIPPSAMKICPCGHPLERR